MPLIGALIAGLVLLGYLGLHPADRLNLVRALRQVIPWLPALYGLVALAYAARYWRWRVLLGAAALGRPSWVDALYWFRGFALTATPAKVGELGRVQLLHEALGYPRAPLVQVFITERLADVGAVAGLLLLVAPSQVLSSTTRLAHGIPIGLAVLTSGLILVFALRTRLLRWLKHRWHHLPSGRLAASYPYALAISVLIWTTESLVLWLLVWILNPTPIGLPSAIATFLLSGTAGIASSLPGGIGVNEATTALLLRGQGIAPIIALPVALLRPLILLWSIVALSSVLGFCRPAQAGQVQARRTTPIGSAFVIGSTSAVAEAICLDLALRGCRRFHLLARNTEANAALAERLSQGFAAQVSMARLDLGGTPSSASRWDAPAAGLPAGEEISDFDLYLITAGTLGSTELALSDPGEALQITAVNYTGLIPWLTAIVTPKRLQRPGRLWVFSSVAADRGRPSNYHYGAAKAGLTRFCEGLLLRCHGTPFRVRIIKAGFISTAMTIGKVPPALCVTPQSVARDLLRRPDRRGIEYLPWWWRPVMIAVRLLPPCLAKRL